MRLDNYDEFGEYVVAKFYEEDDIQAICDYELADMLMSEFGNMDYTDYKGVDLQSDVNEYYVTKFGNKCFCIEPLKIDNKIKMTTSDYFIIDSNILEENPTLFNHLEGNDFKVEIIDYDEDCCCCEDEKEKGILEYNYDYCGYALEDAKFNNAYIADYTIEHDTDEEDLMCLELAELIDDYVSLILDNDCKEEVVGHALTEFGFKVLEKVYLDEE